MREFDSIRDEIKQDLLDAHFVNLFDLTILWSQVLQTNAVELCLCFEYTYGFDD
jgi:hypothetical protein